MPILLKPPVAGERSPIGKGDEAVITRVFKSKEKGYEGIVERRQELPGEHGHGCGGMRFFLSLSGKPDARMDFLFCRNLLPCHVQRYLGTRLAGTLYPDNFVNYHELRLSREESGIIAATYSDFVPDETGVGERWQQLRERVHKMMEYVCTPETIREWAMAEEEKARQVRKAEKREQRLNPALLKTEAMLRKGGVYAAHPQANYHLHAGNTVFMETGGIDLVLAAKEAGSRAGSIRAGALGCVAVMYATLLSYEHCKYEQNEDTDRILAFIEIGVEPPSLFPNDAFVFDRVFDASLALLKKLGRLPAPDEVWVRCASDLHKTRNTREPGTIKRMLGTVNIIELEAGLRWARNQDSSAPAAEAV